MKKWRIIILVTLVVLVIAAALAVAFRRRPLVLTGIVTTDEVIVGSEIQGRIESLRVQPGDPVKRGQLLAVISPAEPKADLAYFEDLERSASAQVAEAEAEVGYQKQLTASQVVQAKANLAAAESQTKQAAADLEIAHLGFERARKLQDQGAESNQDFDKARTAFDAARARVAALEKQAAAAAAALESARAGAAQISVREAALAANRRQLDAAAAQERKAGIRVGYTEVRAPSDGIVNVRAALPGEVVNTGQAIVTLIDPDHLWVRADVEESYIDRIHLGDTFTVRLPSGAKRVGTVFFRGIDADYATQRDVSRTKRDIKTFEVRLRCDNRDRALAVGMTACVLLPFSP